MIKFLKEKWIFLVFVLVVFGILSISGNFKQSTSSAKYRSEISGDDSTRVAKWDVSTISKKDGAVIELDAGFGTTLDTGSRGNWFIEISNSSEVNAILGNDTTIRFRMDHPSYNGESADTESWNFLEGGNNPVTITVTVYKGTIDSLTIDANQQVTNSGVQVFTTTAQTFTKAVETVDSKLVYYYYKDIKVSDIPGLTDTIKTIKMNDSSTNITIGLNWVTGSDTSGTGSTVLDSKIYKAFEIFKSNALPTNYSTAYEEIGRKTYGEDDEAVTYVVAYRDCNFFDYQIFTSSFGGDGEPYFKFKNTYGAEVIKYYSEILDTTEENIVKGYFTFTDTNSNGEVLNDDLVTQVTTAVNGATNLEALEHIIDSCRFAVHEEFLNDNELYQESLSYLQYGLTCSVQFTLKVEQKD